jgi:hypothetical protein
MAKNNQPQGVNMPENKYAVNAPHSPELMQRWGSVNLQKFILTGPAEIAAKLLEKMLGGPSLACENLRHHEDMTDFCRGAAHIACEVAQHFWNDCEQRGWLLTQDQGYGPPPDEEQSSDPVAVTGYSHVDLSDPNNPRALSHEEFLAIQAGQVASGFSINSGVREDDPDHGHRSTDYGESGDDGEPISIPVPTDDPKPEGSPS